MLSSSPPSCPNFGPAPFKLPWHQVAPSEAFPQMEVLRPLQTQEIWLTLPCVHCPPSNTLIWLILINDRNCHKNDMKRHWNVTKWQMHMTCCFESWLDFSLQQCWAAYSPSGVQRPLKVVNDLASLHLAITTEVGAVVHLVKGKQTQLSWRGPRDDLASASDKTG